MTDPDEDMMEVLLGSLKNATSGDLSQMTSQPAPSKPYIEITEQPKQRDHRFRYPVEGRQAGSIAGDRASSDLPSFPSIKVANLTGRAKVVVSLVTRLDPVRPHPHRLVGDNCRDGVCIMMIDPQRPEAVFRKIGVQRTMNKEVENSLKERQKAGVRLCMEVNKGKTGKKHNYDMKAVRLYFEVSMETRESSGVFDEYLTPVTSTTIYDKKDTVMSICRVNVRNGTVAGGDELFILCEKVQSDDIKIKFYGVDPDTGKPWDAYAIFGPNDVHRQYAIVCATPKFVNQNIKAAVTVHFKLYRPSDEESSNEMDFVYKPLDNSLGQRDIERKKRKWNHRDEAYFDNKFTSGGKPLKTETLGASAQSCSGAPISNPISNVPSTLCLTQTTGSTIQQRLRQHIQQKDPSLGGSGSRPCTPSSNPFIGGTAQPMDLNLPMTYTSEAHMSTGRLIQQQQPVSTDTGQLQLDIPAQAMLLSLATNQQGVMMVQSEGEAVCEAATGQEMLIDDGEQQTSLQRIQAIANELMLEGQDVIGAMSSFQITDDRVVVEPVPSFLGDVQFSGLETVDIGAFQDVVSSGPIRESDVFYSQVDGSVLDVNNTSNSNNNNNRRSGNDGKSYPLG